MVSNPHSQAEIPLDGSCNGAPHARKPSRPSYSRWLLARLSSCKTALLGILGASLVLNLCGLVVPRTTQVILDRVLPRADLSLLTQLLLVMALVMGFQVVLTIWRRLLLVQTSLDMDRVLLRDFYTFLLSLPTGFFRMRRTGDLVARFHDGGQVRHLFAGSATRVAIDSIMVLVYFVVMFFYSVHLALLVTVLLGVFAVFSLYVAPRLKQLHRRLMEDKAAQEAQLVETLTGIELVKALGIEEPIQKKWAQVFDQYLESNYRTQRLRQIYESAGTAIQFLMILGLVGYGAMLVVAGRLTTGQLVAFSLYASQAMTPLLSLVALWNEVQEARAGLERMDDVLGQKPEYRVAATVPLPPVRIRGHVRFENVSFQYPGENPAPVLQGISFEIHPGERVAIRGRSGSGKTTLARLLLALYRPTQGRILIDGRDLAQLDPLTYRRQVGVVLQDNLLLSGTIIEVISLGDPSPDPTRVREAAQQAGAHEFIIDLPQEYDTPIGEMGLTLSGGQRQRLSIARALYREPRILVLDEATNALDRFSVQRLEANIEKILADRTCLLISHDAAVMHYASRVLELRNGMIVEAAGWEVERNGNKGAWRSCTAGRS